MKKSLVILCSIISVFSFAQDNTDVDINYMLRGSVYANTSIFDSTSYGGYASSDNSPKTQNVKLVVKKNLFLKIDTTELITFGEKYNGYKFYIGNNTDTIVKLEASDSRLYVVAEVFHRRKWRPIEFLPRSWCGNSYHNLFLKQNEFWEFNVPKFTGKIKSKLRYRLMIAPEKYIYSNEVAVGFNKGQLSKKEKHNPNGIMDPYED
tara:strand:+ start:649 stop:1266 length:618 start_codon:yes stop_codon:yes gene_type:complete